MVAFLGAGSLPKTSRAFVVVVLGFFCSVCRDERKESILIFLQSLRLCSSVCSAPLAAPGLAAIDLEPVQRLKSEVLSRHTKRFAMNAIAALPESWLCS